MINAYKSDKIFTEVPEKEYLRIVPYDHRKKLGQFFTPMFIADLMTEWVVNESGTEILDPALGLGIFFRSIIKNHSNKIKLFKFTGYEIDTNIAKLLKE